MNDALNERLEGLRKILLATYHAGGAMTAASKGREREVFVSSVLKAILNPQFRVATGDITDASDRCSGQVDVVIEYPSVPSVAIPGAGDTRLFFAEGVAAVIEVKSNLQNQWTEVLETKRKVHELKRRAGAGISFSTPGDNSFETIPVFAVGYMGWKTRKTYEKKFEGSGLAGILCIDQPIFIGKTPTRTVRAGGKYALGAFIACLHQTIAQMGLCHHDLLAYIRDEH